MVTEIKTLADFKDAMNSDRLIFIDFFTQWCGPCMRIAPKIEALSAKYPNVDFYKIDCETEALKEACLLLKISSYPTFCIFRNSKYLTRFVGANDKAIEEMIVEYVDKL